MISNNNTSCQSCGMTIDDGTYCRYCTDQDGNLQAFEERLERMVQWLQRRESVASPQEARRRAKAAMAEMPAWRDHPNLEVY